VAKRARDNQRSAVYRWEWGLVTHFGLPPHGSAVYTLDECKELVNSLWDAYGRGYPPHVSDGRGCRAAYGSEWEIKLPRAMRIPTVVLHETAHGLMGCTGPWDFGPNVDEGYEIPAAHGPEFAGLLFELFTHYLKLPRGEVRSRGVHQKPRRVRFAKREEILQPRGRRTIPSLLREFQL
jgi:hypothetical protein